MIHPKSTPIESFEPGLTKVAPELVDQINQKGGPPDEAEGLEMVVNIPREHCSNPQSFGRASGFSHSIAAQTHPVNFASTGYCPTHLRS